jgi:hypothetical protein
MKTTNPQLSHKKVKELMKKVQLLETSLNFLLDSLNKLNLNEEQVTNFNLILEELKAKIST